ncbi:MAG TPA: acyl carrier protein [Solirubrobacterales bacterium]|nr:acyl carrier protein [Solirubrobacterales bacterium]
MRARPAEIERRLQEFIVEELLDQRYDGRDPLATGVVDSLELEQIIAFIEDEFGVRIADDEVGAEHFESLANLAAFVEARQP